MWIFYWWFCTRLRFGEFGLDSSLVDSDSTRVWWTRIRFEHFQMDSDSTRVTVPNDSDSTRVLQWVDSFQHWIDVILNQLNAKTFRPENGSK